MTRFNRSLRHRALLLICAFALSVVNALPVTAQDKSTTPATTAVTDAAQKGFKLSQASSTDVTGNISVDATLIPASIAKTVFGKEVSNNYAVIELTVSNRSSDDAFIVHTIFIDYSQWLLSGSSPFGQNALCPEGAQKKKADGANGKPSSEEKTANDASSLNQNAQNQTSQNCRGNRLQPWQQQTFANQISSVETRIVRGQLLDRQPWTTRNWVLRSLQAAGSIATSFTFVTSSQSWIRGIGAFNGAGIPAYQSIWPDATVGQMNRISDVGFQVNKVIAKQSSDIIVAFFPIDRFLTPDLKSLFISSPAAFFAPIAAMIDPQTQPKLARYVDFIFHDKETGQLTNLVSRLPQITNPSSDVCQPFKNSTTPDNAAPPTRASTLADACSTAELLDRMSLNTVRVVVGGTMTVDVNNVPPQIAGVDIEPPSGETTSSMWTLETGAKSATLSGTIHGRFLGSATPTLVSPPSGITIKRVADGSSDTALQFTLTLTSSLPQDTKQLAFQVSKSSSTGSTIKSATYNYQIEGTAQTNSPQVGNGGAPNPATNLSSPSAPEKPVEPVKK
jgi:hypothetical protein